MSGVGARRQQPTTRKQHGRQRQKAADASERVAVGWLRVLDAGGVFA